MPVTPWFARRVKSYAGFKSVFPRSVASFLAGAGGQPPGIGASFSQPDLARTLRHLAAGGRDSFYRGEIAAAILAQSQRGGGYFTEEDFREYPARLMEPIANHVPRLHGVRTAAGVPRFSAPRSPQHRRGLRPAANGAAFGRWDTRLGGIHEVGLCRPLRLCRRPGFCRRIHGASAVQRVRPKTTRGYIYAQHLGRNSRGSAQKTRRRYHDLRSGGRRGQFGLGCAEFVERLWGRGHTRRYGDIHEQPDD